ncbi:hypothetical protein [Chitinophaga filiformis]|uniref:Oxygen tolerance n=1 Tax=Chitinophaga filiformis TaxID=104663 RepID=A0A1G8BP79_CHIFI|nr:hypothetical protein [Chitinophaga filiformis]SDH34997.1 hypothetical protein SAMN04488121_111111 [Chitinophaga filiformis]
MKTHCIKFRLFLFVSFLVCIPGLGSAQNIALVPGVTSIKYLVSRGGGPADTLQSVIVKVEYWLSGPEVSSPVNLAFQIANLSPGAGMISPAVSMAPGLNLPGSNFRRKRDTIEVRVPIRIHSTAIVNNIEYFSIQLNGSLATDPSHVVIIQENLPSPSVQAKDTSMKREYMFLNAANFDFDRSSNVSYLGHINAFVPDLWQGLGLNAGIMKINFSNDSIQTSSKQTSNVLIKPLDPLAEGTKYLRQFNESEYVTKYIMWSFYFEPFYKIKLSDRLEILPHLHYELQLNKWTTDVTMRNIQTDTLVMNAETIKQVYSINNDFGSGSTANLKSNYSWVSHNVGVGCIFLVKPWSGSKIFAQLVYGISLHEKKIQSARVLPRSFFRNADKIDLFYLTRIYLQQELVGNLDAVLGLNVQKFRTDVVANYAPYLGINVGLDGLKKLVGK